MRRAGKRGWLADVCAESLRFLSGDASPLPREGIPICVPEKDSLPRLTIYRIACRRQRVVLAEGRRRGEGQEGQRLARVGGAIQPETDLITVAGDGLSQGKGERGEGEQTYRN
jgi:hypothetical protein